MTGDRKKAWALVIVGALVAQWAGSADALGQCPDATWAPDLNLGALFGAGVSIDGDTALVGAPFDGDSGAVFVYRLDGGAWVVEAVLTAAGAEPGAGFGVSVSLDGDTALVGAHLQGPVGARTGAAYIFKRGSGGAWQQNAMLLPSGADDGDLFGTSVSLDGTRAVIGASGDDDAGSFSGAAYVFRKQGAIWSQEARLSANPPASGDQYGFGVAISGTTVVVGAFGRDEDGFTDSGAAYVYQRQGNQWVLWTRLTAGEPEIGGVFGRSVCISGETIGVGSLGENQGIVPDTGAVHVFRLVEGEWAEDATLTASDAAPQDLFGYSVSIAGDTLVAGAALGDGPTANSGAAYVFQRTPDGWIEGAKLAATTGPAGDLFGFSVGVAGNMAVVGAVGNAQTGHGRALAFDVNAGPCIHDLDGDCDVDSGDVIILFAHWGPCPPEGGCPDFNGDGVVSFRDLLELFDSWGPC